MHKSTDSPNTDPSPEKLPKQKFLSGEFRLLDRYELQGVLVEALEKTEHHRHLAEKVLGCHKKFRHKRCDQNHDWAKAENSCSCRVCPHCAYRRSRVLAERTQELLVGKTGLRYAVLAERNSTNLKDGIDSLYRAWTSLRRSVCWKGKVVGCIAVLEVTYNKRRRTWHPHLNVLFEGEYFPFAELNRAWHKATDGRGRTTHIQKANEGTVYELIKYTTEIPDLLGDPAVLDEFLSAVYGSRLVRSYGTFHGLKVEYDGDEGDVCPDCGSSCFVDLGRVAHEQLSFDFEKQVFRVRALPDQVKRRLRELTEFYPSDYVRNPYSQAIAVEARRRATQYEKTVNALFAERMAA